MLRGKLLGGPDVESRRLTMQRHYLEFDSITKDYPGVRALDDVSFGAASGSVHALIGENGAGKSTLLRILSGASLADKGRILLDGQAHRFSSPAAAFRAGIAMIHQELQSIPQMSVAENLFLGNMPHRFGWVRRDRLMAEARKLLSLVGEDVDPSARMATLSIAQRQMVEVAKAVGHQAKVIAFDEPTSSLSQREVLRLFALIRRLKEQDRAILYVSHRLEELYQVCDAVTVFRDGRHIETHRDLSVSRDTLVRQMVGRPIADVYEYAPRTAGPAALEARGLLGPGLREPVNLSVGRGEIVGLFGLVGAGRTELLKLIFGAARPHAGEVRVDGRTVRLRSPGAAVRHGIGLCPEDRKREGVVPLFSVQENINLSARRRHCRLGFVLDPRWERRNAGGFVDRLRIRTPSLGQQMMNLSGGNQQKVVLARWLGEDLRVMLLDEPTRGIDVGAKREIYELIQELARQGIALLVSSSELPEIMGISDRVLVMRDGRIVAAVARERYSQETLLKLALPDAGAAAREPSADEESA